MLEATGFCRLGSFKVNEGDQVIETEPEAVGLPPIVTPVNTGIVKVGPASTNGKPNVLTTTKSVSEHPETEDVAINT